MINVTIIEGVHYVELDDYIQRIGLMEDDYIQRIGLMEDELNTNEETISSLESKLKETDELLRDYMRAYMKELNRK